MTGVLGFLVWLVVLAVALYLADYIVAKLPLPAQLRQIVLLVIGVIALVALVQHFFVASGASTSV